MLLIKHTIQGQKGSTVCYTLLNLRFDTFDNKLKWDAFRFYTPVGNKTDSQGFKYFDVPGDEVLIERDDILNKYIMIVITKDEGVEVYEILEGIDLELINIGLEGDIVINGIIPTDTQNEIELHYKEVTDG